MDKRPGTQSYSPLRAELAAVAKAHAKRTGQPFYDFLDMSTAPDDHEILLWVDVDGANGAKRWEIGQYRISMGAPGWYRRDGSLVVPRSWAFLPEGRP